jgi:hypothetical protein
MPMLDNDIRALARLSGVREVAFEDVLVNFPNNDSTSFADWLERIKPSRPHWFKPQTDGSDAEPALYKVEAQGQYVRDHGDLALMDLLRAHGLTEPGQTLKAKPVNAADIAKSGNPWSNECKLSDPEREARKVSIIRRMGTRAASSLAASAGVTLSGAPLKRR